MMQLASFIVFSRRTYVRVRKLNLEENLNPLTEGERGLEWGRAAQSRPAVCADPSLEGNCFDSCASALLLCHKNPQRPSYC